MLTVEAYAKNCDNTFACVNCLEHWKYVTSTPWRLPFC